MGFIASATRHPAVAPGDFGKSPLKRRAEAIEKAKEDAKVVEAMMAKYDTNKSGKLEQEQLAVMLKDLNNGAEPTQDEVNWVFHKADTCTGKRNYGVDPGEVGYAIRIWKGYLDNKEYLEGMFDKYDTEKAGFLSKEQLKVLLTDLCDPDTAPPDEKEVNHILYEADRKDGELDGNIKKTELMYAISLWYTMVKHRKPAKKPSTSVCAIM